MSNHNEHRDPDERPPTVALTLPDHRIDGPRVFGWVLTVMGALLAATLGWVVNISERVRSGESDQRAVEKRQDLTDQRLDRYDQRMTRIETRQDNDVRELRDLLLQHDQETRGLLSSKKK